MLASEAILHDRVARRVAHRDEWRALRRWDRVRAGETTSDAYRAAFFGLRMAAARAQMRDAVARARRWTVTMTVSVREATEAMTRAGAAFARLAEQMRRDRPWWRWRR